MDFNVLIFIAVGVIVVALYYAFIKSKEKIQFDDVVFILGLDAMDDIVPFARIIAEKLGLPEEDAEKYSKIAADTLAYLRSLTGDNKEDIIEAGIIYTKELCIELGLEVDDDMDKVIRFTVRAAHFLIEHMEGEDDELPTTASIDGKIKVVNLKNI